MEVDEVREGRGGPLGDFPVARARIDVVEIYCPLGDGWPVL